LLRLRHRMFQLALAWSAVVPDNGCMKGLGLGLVLAGVSAAGCGDSGQTGSPSCPLVESCACQALAGHTLARTTVIALEQPVFRLDLEELVTPSAALGASDLHRTLVGARATNPACTPAVDVRIGDSVFTAFFQTDHCSEYYACLERECSELSGSAFLACADGCESACDTNEIPAILWIQPWADAIEVGEAAPIALADAIELSDAKTCAARYPPPPSQPCDDTPRGDGGCSVCTSAREMRGPLEDPAVSVASLLFALIALRTRRLTQPTSAPTSEQ
jgi:hypothetical protein